MATQIQSSLHSTFADLQWVVDAYALTLAALLLTSGSPSASSGNPRGRSLSTTYRLLYT